MKFFFDNQLSPHLAAAIRALAEPEGHTVVHLRTKFAPSTADVDWIRELSTEGDWIIICGDLNITRTKAEKAIWKEAKLIGFFLKKGWMSFTDWDQAWRLMKMWPNLMKQASIAAPGSTYFVPVKGEKFETV